MCPSLIDCWILFVLSYTHPNCKTLIVDSSGSKQQFPMKWASCLIETSWIQQNICAFLPQKKSQFSKAEIIADGQTHSAVFSIKNTELAALGEGLRLFVDYFPRDIDVEEMKFVVLLLKFSFWIDYKGCIVKIRSLFTRNAADCIHFMLGTLLFYGIECRGILKILSVFMHV